MINIIIRIIIIMINIIIIIIMIITSKEHSTFSAAWKVALREPSSVLKSGLDFSQMARFLFRV